VPGTFFTAIFMIIFLSPKNLSRGTPGVQNIKNGWPRTETPKTGYSSIPFIVKRATPPLYIYVNLGQNPSNIDNRIRIRALWATGNLWYSTMRSRAPVGSLWFCSLLRSPRCSLRCSWCLSRSPRCALRSSWCFCALRSLWCPSLSPRMSSGAPGVSWVLQ
jgi:hypothetical protein